MSRGMLCQPIWISIILSVLVLSLGFSGNSFLLRSATVIDGVENHPQIGVEIEVVEGCFSKRRGSGLKMKALELSA